MQEGLFLYNHGLSPYDGGVFHQVLHPITVMLSLVLTNCQAPLLLPIFSLLPDPARFPLVTILLYTILDLLSANALMDIAQSAEAYSSRFFKSSRAGQSWQPVMVGASYLLNPFTLLTCLGRPTSVFGNLFILLSISKACSGAPVTSIFALALASYTSLYPLLLLPPLVLLCYDKLESRQASKTKSSLSSFAVRQTASLGLSVGVLLVLSYALTGSWSFISSVYSTRLLLPDLTPNVGLWWYFFIEIFDSFRSFFVGVFWLHLASYSPALTIRLREQPLAVLVLLCGIFAIFQPYANVGDAGMWIGMLSLYGHVFECKYTSSTGL